MKPEYVAKKSAFLELNIVLILLSILVVPLIMQICKIVVAKKSVIEFYPDKIVTKRGFFNVKKTEAAFESIGTVTIQQTFWGRIFNVGSIHIETPKGSIRERLQDAEEFKTAILAQIDQFELDRLSLQADWTAQALLRGSNGVNPYAPKQPQPAPETSPEFDPYGGYGRNPLTGKRN